MTDKELNILVEKLKASNSKEDAIFDINEGAGPDGGHYIKANRQGLRLFAAELLEGSNDSRIIDERKDKRAIPISTIEWSDGDVVLEHIEPIFGIQRKQEAADPVNKFKEKLIVGSILAVVIFIIICLIVGFITIVKDIAQ